MRLCTVVGGRPQLVKAAAVHRVLAARRIDHVLVDTGQHYDDEMAAVFYRELELPPPDHALGVNQLPHGRMTGKMMERLEPILESLRPDRVVVYGDTDSTLAGALVAAKLGIAVAHVEAGLRSFNRAMAEEINRVVTDHVSQLLLCPTRAAVDNLRREGIERGVHHCGDVMYDAAIDARRRAAATPPVADSLGLGGQRYAVATLHRAESTDAAAELAARIDYLSARAGELPVVLPLHPRTRARAAEHRIALDRLRVCPPLGPVAMTRLVAGADIVYTDSGGLQKEAYFHRVPCVTLRAETEWVETIEAGWNRLWTSPDWVSPRRDIDDYGTGDAAARVVDRLTEPA